MDARYRNSLSTPSPNSNYTKPKEGYERSTNCTELRQARHPCHPNQTRREATTDARLAERRHIRPGDNPHMVRRTIQRLRTRHRNRRVPQPLPSRHRHRRPTRVQRIRHTQRPRTTTRTTTRHSRSHHRIRRTTHLLPHRCTDTQRSIRQTRTRHRCPWHRRTVRESTVNSSERQDIRMG